jgi:hypothetical protein
LIEVVDDEAHVDKLLPILDEMVTGGALVTVERVRVVKYAAAKKRETPEFRPSKGSTVRSPAPGSN